MQIRQAYRDEAAEIAPLVQAAVGDIAAELANSPPQRCGSGLACAANRVRRHADWLFFYRCGRAGWGGSGWDGGFLIPAGSWKPPTNPHFVFAPVLMKVYLS